MNIKNLLITIFVLMIIVGTHEAGHLGASREFGLNVSELNVGFKIPYLEILSLHFQINDIGVNLNPILIGGYVIIPLEELNKVGFIEKTVIHGAGGFVNIALGIMVLIVLGIKSKVKISESIKQSLFFPISLLRIENIQKTAAEHNYTKLLKQGNPNMLRSILIYFSLMSIVIGIINLIPVFPLDGGRIMFDVMAHFITAKETEKIILGISLINLFVIDQRKLIYDKIKKELINN